MKKILLITALLSSIASISYAQEGTSCYLKWAGIFDKRGAREVADGTHENVIITVRQGSAADCFTGKVTVAGGIVTSMSMQLEDGAYEMYNPEPRYNLPITVTNGISKTLPTLDDELVNVLFIKSIKPKKANFKAAPNPDDY